MKKTHYLQPIHGMILGIVAGFPDAWIPLLLDNFGNFWAVCLP